MHTFDKHIENICNKSDGLTYYLHKQKLFLEHNSRVCVVEALQNSLLSYCSPIWRAGKKSSILKIQKIPNFAAKVANGIGKKYDRATPYIRKLGWMKIDEKI